MVTYSAPEAKARAPCRSGRSSLDLFALLRTHDLEEIVAVNDPSTGLLGFVVIHDTTRGPGIGGCRLAPYPSAQAALDDGIALAHAMTRKCALAGLAAGGAKGVFLDHPGITDRPAMLRALGRYVDSLAGRFYTSGDLGLGPEDLAYVRETTAYVAVPDDQRLDLAGAAAAGVLAGMRVALRFAGLSGDLRGRTVAVQGLGAMGGRIARQLQAAGATVYAAERDPARRGEFPGVHMVGLDDIYDLEVDVFSPCAQSGVLTPATAARLRCKAVVGAANNPLSGPEVDHLLHHRGIGYAPDYAVNAGAVVLGAQYFLEHLDDSRTAIAQAAERIGDTVARIFEAVRHTGDTPGTVAARLADAALVRPRRTEAQWWPVR